MKRHIAIFSLLMCCVIALSLTDSIYTMAGENVVTTKSISVKVGQKYKISIKKRKNYSYKSNNRKIATVSKKGIITGKNTGKCTIIAKKGKKILKYKVKVTPVEGEAPVNNDNKTTENDSEEVTDSENSTSEDITVGGSIKLTGFKVLSINPIDENHSQVHMEITPDSAWYDPTGQGVLFADIVTKSSRVENLTIGDYAYIFLNIYHIKKDIVGNTLYISNNNNDISIGRWN